MTEKELENKGKSILYIDCDDNKIYREYNKDGILVLCKKVNKANKITKIIKNNDKEQNLYYKKILNLNVSMNMISKVMYFIMKIVEDLNFLIKEEKLVFININYKR